MKISVVAAVVTIGAVFQPAAAQVTATASSSYPKRDPIHAVNGSGLKKGAHDNELNSAWHSGMDQNPWFRVYLGKLQPVCWMKLWNLNWGPYTDRGIRQADIYWSAQEEPGNPVDHPERWSLVHENHQFTRASHWPDYGLNRDRRMPDVVDLGKLNARFICLKMDANFSESGRGYFGISEIRFSADPFPEPRQMTMARHAAGPRQVLLEKPIAIAKDTHFPAPAGTWDLSRFKYVKFELANESEKPVSFSCWVFAPDGWGGSGSFPDDSGLTFLEPGESAKVHIDLHARFLGAAHEKFCKVIDPSRISRVEIVYSLRPGEEPSPLTVRSISAVGKGDPVHDVSGRLLVPEISGGEPAPGKRVRMDRHVMYLPTDWQPGKKYPVIIEYPGNLFYNKFCYSPGLTEYGRLGWGLTKDLGDPDVAGDGFIWLNLSFINDENTEQKSGWGNEQKTVKYCLKTVAEVCRQYGGDPDAVVFTGFSRGSLAANHIGLRTPEMAGLIRAWHRSPIKRAPQNTGGWHGAFVGQNDRIDQHYQGQSICEKSLINMGASAHVDCGYLEDRPDAVAGRMWLKEVLSKEMRPLRNDAYNIWPQPDGSLHIANVGGGGFEVFQPEFTVIHSQEKPTTSRLKWARPVYNLPAWKLVNGQIEADVFKIGNTITLSDPQITRDESGIIWTFTHDKLDLIATISLPDGRAEPRIDYQVKVKEKGYCTFAYSGAPSAKLSNVARLWQPQVWDGRRLPEQSFLIGDDHCSIPGCLVQRADRLRTSGVMADPWKLPYEMPHGRNRRFGVTVRNQHGEAQPLVFAPFPGSTARFKSGAEHRFAVLLVTQPTDLSCTFEHTARNISGFKDQRENTLTTLNQTLDNMADFAMSKWAAFDTENKSSYYPDAKGTVKNVSCLHPFSVALVTDNARLFHEQTVPMMEYLISREKFLFAIDEQGLSHSQKPSMNMTGPAMPVSELAALNRIAQGGSPVFLEQAERLYAVDRKLNMNWVTAGATWQRSLSLYRATGEAKWLTDAVTKADQYIVRRIDTAPVDFSEAKDGTFFEYMIPWWKELYELYLETREPRHLAAAHQGARRHAQFVWFYPSVPEDDITVNPRGLASRRGRPDDDGVLLVPQETVPNWRVSDQGLLCEGNGTVQRLGILIATHAPLFLRIANDTNDDFLRDIARSAVIGRYANFPGYHLNTRFGTAQEKPDFPLHDYSILKPTTSIHYNHILPQVNLVIDYLYSRAYDLSDGAIDFPTEFIEGYAYLQSKLYGAQRGSFHDVMGVRPWMPRKLLEVDDVQANYISAQDRDKLCLAFMNASDRSLERLTFKLNPKYFRSLAGEFPVRIWRDNEPVKTTMKIKDGVGTISVSPKGITALCIEGVRSLVSFQNELGATQPLRPRTDSETTRAMVFSFGPKLRWLYAYLQSEPRTIRNAQSRIRFNDSEKMLRDDSYPFEFIAPLPESMTNVDIEFSTTRN